MFSSIKKIFDTDFSRKYSYELASVFAQNATFSEYTSQTDLALNDIVDTLYNLSFAKLQDLIPNIKPVKYKNTEDSNYAIFVRCYATRDFDDDLGDIVYGVSIWLKTKKGWKTFDPLTNCWYVVTYIPYDSFYVRYRDHYGKHTFSCANFDAMKDHIFVF